MKKTIFILTLCIALGMIFTASENIAKAGSDNV